MPPQLALYGCYFFAFWMFRVDARHNPYPSAVLWLPTLWMMRCASRSVDYWIGGGGEGGRIDPILIAAMIFLGLVVLARRPVQWGGVFAYNSGAFIFYGIIVMSMLWAPDLSTTAIKTLRPLGDLVMALIVVTEPNPRLAIITMFRRTAILLIPLSIVLIRYFPWLGKGQNKHWGADPWVGVTTHKNPLGQLCMLSAFGFLMALREAQLNGKKLLRERTTWLYLTLTLYLLYGDGRENSRSSTSIFCLILGIALYVLLGLMRERVQQIVQRIFIWAAAICLLSVIIYIFGSSPQALVADLFGKDPTLSDRAYLWADVIRIGLQNPFLGTGYGGFWVPSLYPQLSPMVDNGPAEAHNGLLETFANLGLIGVIFLALFVFQSIRSASNEIQIDFELGRLRLVLLLTVVVMNYSEATFPRGTHLWWFGFLIVALSANRWTIRPSHDAEIGRY